MLSVALLIIARQLPIQNIHDAALLLSALGFVGWMFAAHRSDILSREIPTDATAFLLLFLVAMNLVTGDDLLTPIATGVLFGGGALAVTLLSKEAYVGMGDVHVLMVTAFVLGPYLTLLCLLIAGYLSGVRFVTQKNNVLPFGADLAFAAIAILLLQDVIEPWLIFVR